MKHRYTRCHRELVAALTTAREASGLTQRELSAKLKRAKGFVFNVERGLRRIEVCDFFEWTKACKADGMRILDKIFR